MNKTILGNSLEYLKTLEDESIDLILTDPPYNTTDCKWDKQPIKWNEYKKEMLGEGQLFFFYKRQEMVNIPDGNQATGTKNVELTKYVVPLPESETDQRISSTDISNE